MKNLLNYLKALILLVITMGLGSCSNDEPKNENYDVEAVAVISCSPDLLEFVIPTVVIKSNDNEIQRFDLTEADFQETDEWGKISINSSLFSDNTTSSTTVLNNIAKKSIRFSVKLPYKSWFGVHFRKKSDYELNKENYIFYTNIGGIFFVDNKKAKEYVELPIATVVENKDVEDYVHMLTAYSYDLEYEITEAKVIGIEK